MSDLAVRDSFRPKLHLDLWIHQNQLFWSRFQLLYIIQAGFFLILAAVRPSPVFTAVVVFVAYYFLIWLYFTIDNDRRLRNHHAAVLRQEYGFEPVPTPLVARFGVSPAFWEIAFQLAIFGVFAVVDLVAVLYLNQPHTCLGPAAR